MASQIRCKCCKGFVAKDEAVRSGSYSFCSEDHKLSWLRERTKQKVSRSARSQALSRVPTQVRKAVEAADGRRCRLCGGVYGLALHHINYRSEVENRPWMHQPWNLITLCNYPCHLDVVHRDKARFKPILLGLTWLREVNGEINLSAYEFEEQYKEILDDCN